MKKSKEIMKSIEKSLRAKAFYNPLLKIVSENHRRIINYYFEEADLDNKRL